MGGIEQLLAKLPLEMRQAILSADIPEKDCIEEIRIRIGSPVMLIHGGREHRLNGKYGQPAESKLIQDIFNSIMDHSAYAYQDELSKGYITIEGGHRVGVCDKVIMEAGSIKAMKDISSLNLRRSREIIGISDALLPCLFDGSGSFLHTIIVSPPMCGKTTLLRDLIRNLSRNGFRVGVCDERSEIAGCYRGIPSFDLGDRTDIMDGCPKGEGMLMLIRGMSPEIIATDEIGKPGDLVGIEGALCSGVGLLTTIHGKEFAELIGSSIGNLVSKGVFKRMIYLSNKPKIGTITAITDEVNKRLL
jgi:stage III sporulation protein AA